MKKNDFLKNIFSAIKKDNLEKVKEQLENSNIIYFKNKQDENFLFYALQSGSLKVSQYFIEKYPEFLLERNAYLLTPFTDIIYQNNSKGFKSFLSLSKLPNISLNEVYDKGGDIYSVPLLAVEKLTKENWKIFEDLTKKFWNGESLIAKDKLGYNIAHKIAINNADYATSILEYLPKEIFLQLDSETGSSPFLTSLKFSNLEVIKKILKHSNIYQETFLGSNAVHLSIFNDDIAVLKFVLTELKDRPELITNSNLYGDSPLRSAINDGNIEALTLLIPYYIQQNKDLTDEVIHFIKTIPKDFEKFKLFLKDVTPENLSKLTNNEEYLSLFFSYIFHYGMEYDIEQLQKTFLWEYFPKIQSKFLNHQLYSSTILGKKSVKYKINYLLKSKEILTSSESQQFFTPNKDIDLFFSNSDYATFNKNSKISSFISLLNTMPGTQINDLINQTSILKKIDDLDKLHLFCIGLKKKNKELLNLIKLPDNSLLLKGNTNCALMIQDLLSDYDYQPEFQDFFNIFLTNIDFKPIRLFHNYINKIFLSEHEDKMNKIHSVLSLFKDFPEYKKDFIHLLIYRLTQTEENQSDLLTLFVKNDKAILSAIENINQKHINKMKNNEFTRHLLSVYGERKNLIDLLVDIAQSKNIYKHDLMNFISPKCILNTSTSKRLSNKIKEQPMDDYGWAFIIKNFINNKSVSFLIDTYFSSKNKFSDFSQDIVDIIPNLSESNQEYIYKYFINFEFNTKEIEILQSLTKNIELDYKRIIKNSFDNYNFKPLSYLIDCKNIDINSLEVNCFWHNFKIEDFFIDLKNQNQLNSEPLNNYFEFINSYKNKINDTSVQLILESFVNWLQKNDTVENNIAMIRTINIFFKTFTENISIMNEESLIDICKIIISNNDLNNLTSAKEEYEEVLNIIFSKKEYNNLFFQKINNDKFFKINKKSIPEEQQKRLNFYSLSNKLIENNTTTKKTIKI